MNMAIKRINYMCWVYFLLALNAGAAFAGDTVYLEVQGNIVASPCEMSGDNLNKQVELGKNIQAGNMKTAGSTSDWVNFSIDMDKCPPAISTVTMTVRGTADSDNPTDMYKNTGTAENVAIELQSQAGDALGDGKSLTGNITNNAYSYKLRARLYSEKGGVTSGTIGGVVTTTFTWQ